MNNLETCPELDQSQAFIAGTLSNDEASAVAEHLDVCPACEQAVAEQERQSESLLGGQQSLAGSSPLAGRATLSNRSSRNEAKRSMR